MSISLECLKNLPKDKVRETIEAASYDSLRIFTYFIFSASFEKFKGGQHVSNMCDFLQENPWTMRVSARDHFKSTSFYALLMWRLWRLRKYPKDEEWKYFSYKASMAAYHLSEEPWKLKNLIQRNPFFGDLIDLKTAAEYLHRYTWDGSCTFSISPMGLKSFSRGIHCYGIIVDDPFQDPEDKMKLTEIYKINNRMRSNVFDMPHEEGELHIAGTAQTTEDFYFDKTLQKTFAFRMQPAIISWKTKKVLWPEHQPWARLMLKRSRQTDKIFQQEYQCSPAYSEDAYFMQAQIIDVVNDKRPNLPVDTKRPTENDVVAFLDIGKKRHPSHISIFEEIDKRAIMLHHKFMDGWKYEDQLAYCKLAIENFDINYFRFDNTRAEFEIYIERNELPSPMVGEHMSRKKNGAYAGAFGEAVEKKTVELIDDPRLIKSILSVTNDLQAVETPEGHGDAFWSVAGALYGLKKVAIKAIGTL